MRKSIFTGAAIATLYLGAASSVQAATWTFENVIIGVDGSLTGSFDYDAVTNTYSDRSMTIAGVLGTSGSGQSYSGLYDERRGLDFSFVFGAQQNSTAVTGDAVITIFFATDLTDAGGAVALDRMFFSDCAGTDSDGNCTVSSSDSTFGYRSSEGQLQGMVTTNPQTAVVPLPASGLLVLSALGGLAAIRRRKKACASILRQSRG